MPNKNTRLRFIFIALLLYVIGIIGLYLYEYHLKNIWFINTVKTYNMAQLNHNITYNFDEISTRNGVLEVKGWALVKGSQSKNQKVVIVLKTSKNTKYITTESVERKDVTEAFGSDINYDDSGFYAKISASSLFEGSINIGIFLDNEENKSFTDTDTFIVNDSDSIDVVSLSKRIDMKINKSEINNINYFIDAITKKDFGIELAGWAFEEKTDMLSSETFIVLENQGERLVFNTFRQTRDDLGAKYGNEKKDTGFVSRIPYSELDDGRYKVSILIKGDSKQFLKKTDRWISK